jgi:hypothetical protein
MLLSAVRMTSVSIQAAGYKEGSIRQLCRVAGYSTRSPKFKLRQPPRCLGFRRVRSRLVEHLFSRHVCVGEGAVKSLGPSSRDRVAATRAFPQNSENFFYLCSMWTWQPRGREHDELRGSFLPPNSNAGGNRARGCQLGEVRLICAKSSRSPHLE